MRLLDGEEVEHGLCGMMTCSITSVENRNTCSILCITCSTLPRVAHGDNVSITVDHLDGIEQRFSLDNRGRFDISEVDNIASKTLHRRLKGHSCACAWFKEQVSENLALQQWEIHFTTCDGQKSFSISKNAVYVVVGQIVHRDESFHRMSPSSSTIQAHP